MDRSKSLGALVAAMCLFAGGCSKKSEEPPPAPAPAAAPAAAGQPGASPEAPAAASAAPAAPVEPGSLATAEGKSGTLTADPNPVVICKKGQLTQVKISWEAKGTKQTQVRIGAPDGALFQGDGAKGAAETGKWVGPGTKFFLQDAANATPTSPGYTLAQVEITAVDKPCP